MAHGAWVSIAISLPTLSAAFGDIVRAMARKVGDIVFRDRSTGPFLSEMNIKLNGLIKRFNAIAIRVQAGTLRATPKRRAGATRTVSPRKASLLPTRFEWLNRLTPEASVYGGLLDEMVRTDLEMVALLTAAPQAKAILRSLYWMLGRRPLPDILRRPKAAPRARAARAVLVGKPVPTDTGRSPHRPSARWPKGCVTRHPRAPAEPVRPRSTAGPTSRG